ncbi:MAG TPA: glycosyl hydrolase family 18 protein [Phenylobacterium sp.]|nr:glycosyl hydrolase family 18 protein [Phenylobacterium sp.]
MRTANSWRSILGLALALAMIGAPAPAGPGGSARPTPATPQLVAFYIPWDAAALASLKAHVNQVDVFSPMWASLVAPSGKLVWESDEEAHAVLAAASRRPKVVPIVSNAHDDVWDSRAAEGVITDDRATAVLAANLVARAKSDPFAGVVVDFENLTPGASAGYAAFLGRLRARLRPAGLEVWTTATLTEEDKVGDLSSVADAVVLMAYDQCWASSTPGPIADDAWLRANLAAKLAGHDPRRYVVALAAYGYDWPKGRKGAVIAASAAARLALRTGQPVQHAAGSNAHFGYTAANGARHEVWYADAADFARQRAIAGQRGVRGVALWRMGLEDPGLWTARAAVPSVTAAGATAFDCEPLAR